MEKRIKILYSLTIAAILAFLGMQIYWLYSRYEFSIWEYEDYINVTVQNLLTDYKSLRSNWCDSTGKILTNQSSYCLNTDNTPSGIKRHATIISHKYSAHELLGINERRILTQEEQKRAAQIINDSIAKIETIKQSYDASNAPSDAAVWGAMKNFDFEILSPFTVSGIDSLLNKANIKANVRLTVTDTMVWVPSIIRHTSSISPRMQISVPYSELERKSVVIDCEIPPVNVVKDMGWTLILALALSLLLILCLVWQFSTILKLNRLDNMRNLFITTMIHELKRPISTLKMCVSGIENEKMLSDDRIKKELIGESRTALDNLSAYFSRLRDITFNNVEQIPLNIAKFNLSKLVNDVIYSASIPSSKNVKFENNVDEGLEISADRSHIYNIINNLVENAIKYSGESVAIKIDSKHHDDNISIIVSDNGAGISDNDLKHIFHRFYRGRGSATDIPGMGLGLAYVKLLVEAHGGHVTAYSKLGEGTSFIINIPQ